MYFVTMTDGFMSGWGKAKGLTNKLIFECETKEEQEIVYQNGRAQGGMSYVHKCRNKPSYYRAKSPADYAFNGYYVQKKDKEVYPHWYVKDYFKTQRIAG